MQVWDDIVWQQNTHVHTTEPFTHEIYIFLSAFPGWWRRRGGRSWGSRWQQSAANPPVHQGALHSDTNQSCAATAWEDSRLFTAAACYPFITGNNMFFHNKMWDFIAPCWTNSRAKKLQSEASHGLKIKPHKTKLYKQSWTYGWNTLRANWRWLSSDVFTQTGEVKGQNSEFHYHDSQKIYL